MEVLEQAAAGVAVFAITGLLAWLASKGPSIRSFFSARPPLAIGSAVAAAAPIGLGISTLHTGRAISGLRADLQQWSALGVPSGPHGSAGSTCPEGAYVVGIELSNRPGGGSGYPGAANVVCRRVNAAHR